MTQLCEFNQRNFVRVLQLELVSGVCEVMAKFKTV